MVSHLKQIYTVLGSPNVWKTYGDSLWLSTMNMFNSHVSLILERIEKLHFWSISCSLFYML